MYSLIIEITINGLLVGAFYAAIATGLALVFGINNIVNFAHGEFLMLGGFSYILLVPFVTPFGGQAAAFIIGAVIAYVFYDIVLKIRPSRLIGKAFSENEYQIITTFALSILMINCAILLFGSSIRTAPAPVIIGNITSSIAIIVNEQLVAGIQCVALLAVIYLFLMHTSIGRLVRGASQNTPAIATLGVDAVAFSRYVFAAACGLASLVGAMIAPVFAVFPESGMALALKSFVIVVIGGFGSFTGAIVGGILLGLIEAYGGAFISSAYKDAFGFILLLCVLFVRPSGLMGNRARGV